MVKLNWIQFCYLHIEELIRKNKKKAKKKKKKNKTKKKKKKKNNNKKNNNKKQKNNWVIAMALYKLAYNCHIYFLER